MAIFDYNSNHVTFSDQIKWLSCRAHCLFICSYFSHFFGWELWLVHSFSCFEQNYCSDQSQIQSQPSHCLVFHLQPDRRLTCALLLSPCIIPVLLIFWLVMVLLLQPSLENGWLGTCGPGVRGLVWLGVIWKDIDLIQITGEIAVSVYSWKTRRKGVLFRLENLLNQVDGGRLRCVALKCSTWLVTD